MRKSVALHKKWSFQLRISSVNVTKSTEEILNRKLHFLCSVEKDDHFRDFREALSKARGADKDNSSKCWLFLTYNISDMTLLIDDIDTSERHFHFYFPWCQNYSFWPHILMLAKLGEPFTLFVNQSFENLFSLGMTVPSFILEEKRCLKGVR